MQQFIDRIRSPLKTIAALSVCVNLLLLVPVLFMMQVFDRVLTSGSTATLVALTIGAAVALGLMLVLDYLRSRLQGVTGTLLGESLFPAVARHVLAEGARSGRPAPTEPLRDVGTLRNLFSSPALLAVFDAPWLVVYVLVIAFIHPLLGLTAAVAAAAMFGLAVLNDRLNRRSIEKLQRDASTAQRTLESSMHNAEVAEAMGMSGALLARWQRMNARVLELQSPTARRSVAMTAAARTLRQSVQVLMLAVGAWLVITKAASPGVMIAATILLGRALAPVEQVVGGWKLLAEGRAALARLRSLLDVAGSDEPAMALPAPGGFVSVSGVVWNPPGTERLVLAGVSFDLAAGESLAVIGPSGAGKSTLIRLLAGLWRPRVGSVRLDGAEIADWPREDLGPHIGYVPQDVELFDGTVAENIARLGEVDSEAVVTAARAAGIHELVLALPQGYDTRVERGAALLSPGQRQRIALARALYGQPKLLLLDEPNANLDGAGEQALGEALAALRGRVTVVIVTHRTTLLQNVDKMLMLEQGRAKHCGPVNEVLHAMRQGGAQVVAMPRHAVAHGAEHAR
jgi:PrtD family type I secretion system ABC transporter